MTQQALDLRANDRQVGGNHYKKHLLEHWDTVILFGLDYFQASIWKYTLRWRDKNGIQDLEKVAHYAQKYIEVEKLRAEGKLTRSILERAILALEEIEQQEEQAAMYRAQAKGDDPVADVLSGYRFNIMPAERGAPAPILSAEENERRQPNACTHDSDDCPVHPNGGCPALPAATARP